MMNNRTKINTEIMNKQYITTTPQYTTARKQYVTPFVELADIAADDRFMIEAIGSNNGIDGGDALVKEHKTWSDEAFEDNTNPNTKSLWDEDW